MKTLVACLLAVAPVSIFGLLGLQEFRGEREPLFPGHPTAKMSFGIAAGAAILASTLDERNHGSLASVTWVLAAAAMMATVSIGILDHFHRLPRFLWTAAERADVETWRMRVENVDRPTK